jgi:hypothetical protein
VKLSDYKQEYYQFTSLASSTSRQLALAGIALIWVFKTEGVNGYELPNALLIPTVGLIVSLGSDLLQYFSGSLIWGAFHRHCEKKYPNNSDPKLEASVYFNWPGILFFYTKIISVLISYWYLLFYAISSITFK